KEKYGAFKVKGKVKAKGKVKDISRRVYTMKDIDINQKNRKGLTNLQLMKSGNAPFAKDGTQINLHHLIQEEPGPMLEIPNSLHTKYSGIIHRLKSDGESFRNDPVLKAQYDNFRDRYWKWRAKQYEK
ncbi:HNH/ENDO VII family nuclease, partial [Bacillus velezensis]